jgi:hypothetical protein
MSNNLFAGLVVGYEGGALPAEALFVTEPIEWGASNLVGALVIPLFLLLTRPGRPKKALLRENAGLPGTDDRLKPLEPRESSTIGGFYE